MRSSSAITIEASSTSWWRTASSTRSSDSSTMSMPPSARDSSSATRWWKSGRRSSAIGCLRSAELAGDVVLGALVRRVGEDLLRLVDLDEDAGPAGLLDVEERGVVARARGLLHVV